MHHAHLIVGNNGIDYVRKICISEFDFNIDSNPDFYFVEAESFGIDNARDFSIWMIGKPFVSEIKVAFVSTQNITVEAQNALLKVIEEPKDNTYVFINTPQVGSMLGTLLSRINLIYLDKEDEKSENNNADKFVKSDLSTRLALIKSMSKKDQKEDMKKMLGDLEVAYRNIYYGKENIKADHIKNSKHILKAKILASARGSSPKMLLEWLACVL